MNYFFFYCWGLYFSSIFSVVLRNTVKLYLKKIVDFTQYNVDFVFRRTPVCSAYSKANKILSRQYVDVHQETHIS